MSDLRAKKAGIGAEIEKKLEGRYDQEDEAGTTKAIQLWLNTALEHEHDPIPTQQYRDLYQHLRDGVMLCKLVNKLLEHDGKQKVHFQKGVRSMFVAFNNIENYNTGCMQYGLVKEFCVQSADVWEGSKARFLNLVNNIHSLGFVANNKGFQPTYTGEQQRSISFD